MWIFAEARRFYRSGSTYVILMRRIYVIDCPRVVYPRGVSETRNILERVVEEKEERSLPWENEGVAFASE
ncbi:hypothetical protein ANCCAN_23481 [Ancylostoma caninum]|uniref:Uncharacterized protein n=1 Tax=Ancylostoma caninum TaxID=29170 RepID=A0A368FF24_ANCCA|nr:hypothetical protein ANCCAN_23481 [Ancylostoma caninum]